MWFTRSQPYSSEGLTEAKGSLQDGSLMFVCVCECWQLPSGCWPETRPHGSLQKQLESLQDVAADLPIQSPERGRENVCEKERAQSKQGGSSNAFNDLVTEPRCHLCFILVVRSESLSPAHTQEQRNEAPPLEGRNSKELVDAFLNLP